MNIPQPILDKLTPEATAILTAISIASTPQIDVEAIKKEAEAEGYKRELEEAKAAIQGHEVMVADLHTILSDHLGKEAEPVGIRARVLAAAIGARKHLEDKQAGPWRMPRLKDLLKFRCAPPKELVELNSYNDVAKFIFSNWDKVRLEVRMEGCTTSLPPDYKSDPAVGVVVVGGAEAEGSVIIPISILEPAAATQP